MYKAAVCGQTRSCEGHTLPHGKPKGDHSLWQPKTAAITARIRPLPRLQPHASTDHQQRHQRAQAPQPVHQGCRRRERQELHEQPFQQRQKQPLTLPFAPDAGPGEPSSFLKAKPAALRHCFPVRKAAGFRVFIFRWGRTAATVYQTARAHGSADRSDTASPAGTRSRWKHGIPPGKRALPRWPCWRCGPA